MRYRSQSGQGKIAQLIQEESSTITPEYGIELSDVQIKRVNYVEAVQQQVFRPHDR